MLEDKGSVASKPFCVLIGQYIKLCCERMECIVQHANFTAEDST